MTKRGKYQMSEDEAREKLDRMVRRHGWWYTLKIGFGGVLALCPAATPVAMQWAWYWTVLGCVVSGILCVPVWWWSVRFHARCPRCGHLLETKRLTGGFTDTVIHCPHCHLKSDKFQDFEGYPGV